MSEPISFIPSSISAHYDLIIVSIIGGFVLSALKIAEHFSRKDSDKLKPIKYFGFFICFIRIANPWWNCCRSLYNEW